MSAKPVGAAEFAKLLMPLKPAARIAVALSGGPDSLALLFLAARWARARKRPLTAYTVDHGLRAGSAEEAKRAARMAKALGLRHRILKWTGEKPEAGIQAAARDARYRLLAEACAADGIGDLLVAHHLEDQAETFLLRLARGSGVDGLAGMAATRELGGVRLVRPLLGTAHARLVATIEKAKLEPILDPSNENARFDRVKARRLMETLSTLGLDARRLADTAAHMARARAALETETRALLAAQVRLAPEGYARVGTQALLGAPEEIGLRTLAEVLKCVGGGDYPPRFEALTSLYGAIAAGTLGRGRTLNGCKVVALPTELLVLRETAAALAATPLRLKAGEAGVWDGRFHAKLAAARAGAFEVRALGPQGLVAVRAGRLALPEMPKAVLPTLPALWQGDKLVAASHIGAIAAGIRFDARSLRRGLFGPA
ncbi:MAG TPA: tRNA lysidine(34) synthetase TilS [Parvibaculum sp.]